MTERFGAPGAHQQSQGPAARKCRSANARKESRCRLIRTTAVLTGPQTTPTRASAHDRKRAGKRAKKTQPRRRRSPGHTNRRHRERIEKAVIRYRLEMNIRSSAE